MMSSSKSKIEFIVICDLSKFFARLGHNCFTRARFKVPNTDNHLTHLDDVYYSLFFTDYYQSAGNKIEKLEIGTPIV